MGRRKVANRKEIAAFWTSMMQDDSLSMTERFKASELLAKYAMEDVAQKAAEKENVDLRWFKDEAEAEK